MRADSLSGNVHTTLVLRQSSRFIRTETLKQASGSMEQSGKNRIAMYITGHCNIAAIALVTLKR